MIYSLYLFDRHCNCIYSREWTHKDEGSVNKSNESDASKLLFGLIYSLKNISTKLGSPENSSQSQNVLKSFSTKNYRIHLFETALGLRFSLISDVNLDNLQAVLHKLYTDIYLRTVVHNSLSPVDFKPGERISNSDFIIEVDNLIQGLSVFE